MPPSNNYSAVVEPENTIKTQRQPLLLYFINIKVL